MNKRLLSIQDVSCVGQCSLTVALPIISACGIETAILPSAVLSTHTGGFKHFTFCDLTGEMGKIEEGWKKEGITFDAFYTGYVCPSQIDPILSIMKNTAAPGALKIVDPAMADNGKLYPGFGPDFPSQMKRLCEVADYLLPNLTEAALLVGQEPVLSGYDEAYIVDLAKKLYGIGAKNVLLTGVSYEAGKLGVALYDGSSIRYYFRDKLERLSHGTGDIYASVFAGALLRGAEPLKAAALAAEIVCKAIEATSDDHWYGVCFEKTLGALANELDKLAL